MIKKKKKTNGTVGNKISLDEWKKNENVYYNNIKKGMLSRTILARKKKLWPIVFPLTGKTSHRITL